MSRSIGGDRKLKFFNLIPGSFGKDAHESCLHYFPPTPLSLLVLLLVLMKSSKQLSISSVLICQEILHTRCIYC